MKKIISKKKFSLIFAIILAINIVISIPIYAGDYCSHGYYCFCNGGSTHYVLSTGVGPNIRYYYVASNASTYSSLISTARNQWVNTSTTPGVTTNINWGNTTTQSGSICDIYYQDATYDCFARVIIYYSNGTSTEDIPTSNYHWGKILLNSKTRTGYSSSWFNSLTNDTYRTGVIAHEWGHIMSLTHINNSNRLMYPYGDTCNVFRAQTGELNTINHIYP